MKRWLKKESGLSLMELLATIVIASILITFIMGIFIFMQKKSDSQKDEVKGLSDITIALKSITKDIRFAETGDDDESKKPVETSENEPFNYLFIRTTDGPVTYELKDDILMKNNSKYIYDVQKFEAIPDTDNDNKIDIYIKSKSGKEVSTEIVLRGGATDDEPDE